MKETFRFITEIFGKIHTVEAVVYNYPRTDENQGGLYIDSLHIDQRDVYCDKLREACARTYQE